MTLVLATHNPHKVGELAEILRPVLPLADGQLISAAQAQVGDTVEDGTSFAANALLKARAAAAASGMPALADDSGLCVQIMGGAPGIFSARWVGHHGDDDANLRLLLAQLADIAPEHRRAHFECCAALALPNGFAATRTGIMTGTLTREPVGTGGFGYDPIFVADGQRRTNAQLTAGEKNAISHRARAFVALSPVIAECCGLSAR